MRGHARPPASRQPVLYLREEEVVAVGWILEGRVRPHRVRSHSVSHIHHPGRDIGEHTVRMSKQSDWRVRVTRVTEWDGS